MKAASNRFMRVLSNQNGRPRARAKLYDIWDGMKKRCYTPSNGAFYHYGAKGVRVCDEWRTSYEAFRAWAISHGFRKGLTLDRVDNALGYSPENCRWATREEQTYNSSRCHLLTLNGVTKLLPIWAKELGVQPTFLRSRRARGWTDEQILTSPWGKHREGVVHQKRGRKPKSAFPTGCSPDAEAKR